MITAIHFINILCLLTGPQSCLGYAYQRANFFCLFRGFVTDQLIAVRASLRSALGSANLSLFGLAYVIAERLPYNPINSRMIE